MPQIPAPSVQGMQTEAAGLLAANSKAIAGFIVVAIVAYLAKHGLNADVSLGTLVDVLVNGAIGFVVVWLSPKNK